jgi:hypothetical protein
LCLSTYPSDFLSASYGSFMHVDSLALSTMHVDSLALSTMHVDSLTLSTMHVDSLTLSTLVVSAVQPCLPGGCMLFKCVPLSIHNTLGVSAVQPAAALRSHPACYYNTHEAPQALRSQAKEEAEW